MNKHHSKSKIEYIDDWMEELILVDILLTETIKKLMYARSRMMEVKLVICLGT
jgi:hypothetical protein